MSEREQPSVYNEAGQHLYEQGCENWRHCSRMNTVWQGLLILQGFAFLFVLWQYSKAESHLVIAVCGLISTWVISLCGRHYIQSGHRALETLVNLEAGSGPWTDYRKGQKRGLTAEGCLSWGLPSLWALIYVGVVLLAVDRLA